MSTNNRPMHIAVIGANGKTGREFVQACLQAGHFVHAGIHRKNTLQPHPRLKVFSVDATKAEDIALLFDGCSVVVSVIGHNRKSPPDVQAIATKNSIQQMKKLGITRIISLTGTGVRFPGDKPSIIDRLLNITISLIDPKRIHDGINHAILLQNSGLDWTLLRVLKLTNGTLDKFHLNSHGPTRLFTPRKVVASALLQIVDSHDFSEQAPIVV